MSPQADPQSGIENMLGDPDFHQLEGPEQRQLLRQMGMGDRSDQDLDSLVQAARAYHGMSPLPPAGTPLGKFLTSAGQAFQAANPITGHPGESILHMIGGPDPTTGETTADWARSLPGVSTYENLRQGRIAEELGSWMPGVALGLLTGGVARFPEIAEATGTGAGATWAGLKGAGRAYSTEKTLLPAAITGTVFQKLGEHLDIPYGWEVGSALGAAPSMGKGFVRGVREYFNPPMVPRKVVAPPPITGSSTARFAEPLPEARPVVPAPPVTGSSTARFAEPLPEARPVVAAPPVVYRQPPAAEPVVPAPPVTGSSTARFNPIQPATGAPKRTPIGPLQFRNRFWTAPEGEGEGEGIPPAGPEKGTPVNPVDKMDRTALNATLHSEAQDLDIAPVGGLRGAGHNVKVPSGFMDIVAKDKFGKPYRELSDDQLRQMINDRTLHNYKVK